MTTSRSIPRFWRGLNFLLLATLHFSLGCGDNRPDRVPVSGQVLIDGKPLTHGFIQFIPSGNRASGGKLDSEGRFSLSCFTPGDGAVLGSHRILVAADETVSAKKIRWHAPKKYADQRTSEIAVEITQPTDSLKIDLTWDGGRPFIEPVDGEEEGITHGPKLPK